MVARRRVGRDYRKNVRRMLPRVVTAGLPAALTAALLAATLAALTAALLAASNAEAGSLPSVKSGPRPGPPLLYAPPPDAPPLSVTAPFRADPLLVSGTDAYRDGEYLYQDYLFDDHGADSASGPGMVDKPGPASFSPAAGDVAYPTGDRFARNAADLVELRIKPTGDAIVYRVTLNTVTADDTAAVGVGIDTDRSGGLPVPWPGGAGLTTPGLDRFITAWGTGGVVTGLPAGGETRLADGAVTIDREKNQMTIRVPRSVMDPGTGTWRYVAGVGLRQGSGFKPVPPGGSPTADEPASGGPGPAAAIFNLAFRFDEPTSRSPLPGDGYTTFPGIGNFFEDKQARDLKSATTGSFHADVDFGKLAAGASEPLHAPQQTQARIHAARKPLPEGVREGFPEFGGQLQPYLLRVPPGYDGRRAAGLTFTLPSLGGTYTQYAVFSPNQLRQFGDERGSLVVSPLGRGPDGWYTDEAEVDFFEVWSDAARHFKLNSRRVALTGYSMGGYGTYKLGTQYPDLFGRAFTAVGPPGLGIWLPPAPPQPGGQDTLTNLVLENARWLPYLNWVAQNDQLVPYPGPLAQQTGAGSGRGFDTLGLRSTLETFQGDHFTLAIADEWAAARDFLGAAAVKRDPSRVDYAFLPDADRPKLGLVHDHAYWVSRLRARVTGGDPDTAPSRAELDARSQAFGEGHPVTAPVVGGGAEGRPSPSTVRGTGWESVRPAKKRNRLLLALENVRSGRIDGRRARLRGSRPLFVKLRSDGPARIRLALRLPRGAKARVRGSRRRARGVKLSGSGATFKVRAGTREFVIARRAR